MNIEHRKFAELMTHLETCVKSFAKENTRGEKDEDMLIMLLCVKSFLSLMVASIAKVLDDKPKEKLLENMMEEIKDQFLCFDELENKKASYQ